MAAYLPQLKNLIKTGRIEQAREQLAGLHARPEEEKQQVIEILALASEKTALILLPYLLAEAGLSPDIRERLLQVVTDRAHLDFSFARILMAHGGRAKVVQATPLLKHILTRETDETLLGDILRTAGKFRVEALVDDVAEFIFYDNVMLKSEAVRALERIGGRMVLERLEKVAKTRKCDQDILDVIDIIRSDLPDSPVPAASTDLPDSPALSVPSVPTPPPAPAEIPEPAPSMAAPEPPTPEPEPMPPEPAPPRTAPRPAHSPAPEETGSTFEENLSMLSSDALGKRYQAFAYFTEHGARVAEALSAGPETMDHNCLVCLLRLVSRTIPQSALGDLLNLVSGDKIPAPIKFAAYDALYAYPEMKSAAAIIKGITESATHVRMAAVKVLGKNCTDYVTAEIRNKIESGTKTGEVLAQTVLDVREQGLIEALMASDTFSYVASNYLEKSAPLSALDAFIAVLEKRKRKSTARKYQQIRDEKADQDRQTIMVVSPSPVYLDVYAKLIYAAGFFSKPFSGTQEAFEDLVSQKPAAVICDPFLNNMTAMDFASEARELYRKEDLPITVSLLQKGLDKEILASELETSGVTGFCDFPARAATIKSWIKQQ